MRKQRRPRRPPQRRRPRRAHNAATFACACTLALGLKQCRGGIVFADEAARSSAAAAAVAAACFAPLPAGPQQLKPDVCLTRRAHFHLPSECSVFPLARCHRNVGPSSPLRGVSAEPIPSEEDAHVHVGSGGKFRLVPRLSQSEYSASPIRDAPVLISDIFSSPDDVEATAGALLDLLSDVDVVLQRNVRDVDESDGAGEVTTELYDVTLGEAVDCAMGSSHDDIFFAFCEGLLPTVSGRDYPDEEKSTASHGPAEDGLSGLSHRLAILREKPFSNTENWFDYFLHSARPSDAVILAGEGATSTFHRDPFEWTGTSLCLDGTKVWRFVMPPSEGKGGVEAVDGAVGSYRLDSIAWSGEEEGDGRQQQLTLSAGWQSDLNLFESRSSLVRSAEELAELAEGGAGAYQMWLEDIATNPRYISPSPDAIVALDKIRSYHQGVDESEDSDYVVAAAIQLAGDLLLIPAHCWHQTYASEPSIAIAIASQRCGAEVDAVRVLRHVLETVGASNGEQNDDVPKVLSRSAYCEGDAKEVVGALFGYLSKQRKLA